MDGKKPYLGFILTMHGTNQYLIYIMAGGKTLANSKPGIKPWFLLFSKIYDIIYIQ
jgi:hypothetical protein